MHDRRVADHTAADIDPYFEARANGEEGFAFGLWLFFGLLLGLIGLGLFFLGFEFQIQVQIFDGFIESFFSFGRFFFLKPTLRVIARVRCALTYPIERMVVVLAGI